MSLFRRKKTPFWWYDFTFQGRRYKGSTKETTKAAARTVEHAAFAAVSSGIPPKSARTPTLREFAVRFTAWSDNSIALSPASKKFYRYGLRLLLFTRLADTPLDAINREIVDCVAFTRPVIDRRTKCETGQTVACSNTYINQALGTLKAMCGKAVEWGVLKSRPAFSKVKVQGRDRLIDHETEIRLQEQLGAGNRKRLGEQAWLVLVILQDTGMRPDEVYPMRIEDIHWGQNRIWVPKGKTANARRFVGMSERMRDMLTAWCQDRQGWVFPSRRSRSGHLESISKGFQNARRRAGLDPRIVPYSARHTYATYQMQATGNTFAVSRSMGHAGVKSMEPYQHPDTSTLNSSIDERNRMRAVFEAERITTRRTTGFVM